tara:strand:- start:10107 stop:11864 length:1758 start_codon:yes stop_codon:yes gene_type:complete
MKRIKLLLGALTLCTTVALTAQELTGKKATLNEDGTFTTETVDLPPYTNAENSMAVDLLFSFGKPANPGIKNSRGATLADINNDGVEEIIYGIDTTLYALDGDGNILFEKTVLGPILLPPTVVDLDDDGNMEIIINTGYPTTVGRLYVTDGQGVDLPGWPLNFNDNWMINAPAVADLDGDGTLDIIAGERAGSTQGFVHALNIDGTSINAGYPVEIPATPAFTPSIGDIDNDGNKDLVIAASSAGMYAFDNQGNVLTGFPVVDPTVRYSYQSPILVDLDGDEDLEIVGSNHGDAAAFYVMNHDGTYYPGWPLARNEWTYSPATVADIDNDGTYEIFMGDKSVSGTGDPLPTIFGLTPSATDIPNFPIEKYGGNEGVLSIADINNDDVLDIIFTSNVTDMDGNGYLHAYSTDGSGEIDGFPLRPRGFTFLNSAVLGDVDGDGMMDLTSNSYTLTFGAGVDSTFVNSYNLNVPYNADKIIRNGYKGNNFRDGLVEEVPLDVNEVLGNVSISISPNPSDGSVTLMLPSAMENASVKIYSIDGKEVFSEETKILQNEGLTYNFRKFSSGLYFINISDGTKTFTGKWIKN